MKQFKHEKTLISAQISTSSRNEFLRKNNRANRTRLGDLARLLWRVYYQMIPCLCTHFRVLLLARHGAELDTQHGL